MTCLRHAFHGRLIVAALAWLLGGCAALAEFQPSVAVHEMTPSEYVALRRGDFLGTGQLSALTAQTIRAAGFGDQACMPTTSPACIEAMTKAEGMDAETRLSALAELWLQRAVTLSTVRAPDDTAAALAWIETARHAYAYLFFTPRPPGERAFEERQTQVRDWYNYAVQQTVTQLFRAHDWRQGTGAGQIEAALRLGSWTPRVDLQARLAGEATVPRELLPASTLAFQGLRGIYRRDGLGAELVAVTDTAPNALRQWAGASSGNERGPTFAAWSEMPTPNVTIVLRFEARTLQELLSTNELIFGVHDPLMQDHLLLHGQRVPLAGNFTAGYGLWLARADFSRRSLRGLFGREQGIDHPQLYLMQPFDPQRRVIVMLHGLASSPEAWVNVANEILADEALRREFQIWQVYYPTNIPMPASHMAIRQALLAALRHFDPGAEMPASRGLVLIGHSMGGVITRLMVSTADQQLWQWAESDPRIGLDRSGRHPSRLDAFLRFQPLPSVERAIFIAAPHRGTAVAGLEPARWVSGLIRLPLMRLQSFANTLGAHADAELNGVEQFLPDVPNSLDQLDENDPFIKAASTLSISDRVPYHSIIARRHAEGALMDSDDGLVPYRSAHLEGATSERIIVSGHSVQEDAAAIAEIRRILKEDIANARSPVAD